MREEAATVTDRPAARPVDIVLIGVCALMQIMLIRVTTGTPPLWAGVIVGGITGAAWIIGRMAAHRQRHGKRRDVR